MRRSSRRPAPGAAKLTRGRRGEAREEVREEAAEDMDVDNLQDSDPKMDDDESSDGSFSTCFSASREVADKELNANKKAVLEKSSFGTFKSPSGTFHFVCVSVAMFFIWNCIAMFFVLEFDMCLFVSHKNKTILFTRDMVHKIFNIPSGPRAVELLKRNERCELRDIYREGTRAPMKKSISVIKKASDNDVVTLERTWVLLCLALVLVPGTGNMVSLDYLASLKDLDELNEFAWDEHVLATALREARNYQLKREAGASGFWIGGCLPMFVLIYMDFLDVPRSLISEETFNYSLPRACFVCNADFELVKDFDRNKLTLETVDFGKRNHRPLSQTPYAILKADKQCEGQNQHHPANITNRADKANTQVSVEGDLGAKFRVSLDEWLQPLPSCQELEIPLHLKPIYEKHKNLYTAELKNVVTSFGQVLQSTFCKRLGLMLMEAHSNAVSNHEHRSEGFVAQRVIATSSVERTGAVTFGTPTATAAGIAIHSSKCPLSDPDSREEAGADDQNKAQPGGVVATPKVVETGALGEKVGVEAKQGAGQSTSVAKRSRSAALQQGESSNHSHGKDCVEQEEVIHQGGKVTPKDVCNMDPSGAFDKVETPVLSQGTVQAMMVTSLEWEDGPSCALFVEGTEDYEWMNQKVDIPVKHVQTPNASSSDVQNSIPLVPNFDNTLQVERPSNLPTATFDTAPKLPRANDIPGPVFDVSPISLKNASSDGPQVVVDLHETTEANVAVRGESNSLGKQSKKKRVALSSDNVPTMKKIKMKEFDMPDFIEIDGFHTSLENFHASLKPRAEIDNEVMTLYLKTFNYDHCGLPSNIFLFCDFLHQLKLSAEPDVFDPKVCEKEFKNACLQNHISKSDLLFFMVVHKKH
ncbi:uncharacterized protein LOC125516965 [Triticum urartu]|uniref:uncharacterized protein LOC125516965 n=1 Tax=Triticum urartu TaxID=4572 RepID=UPI002044140A|nr:uncharacterized protein LOC125516965 [Triticum urartu]